MNTSFFGELLQTISERGRACIDAHREKRAPRWQLSKRDIPVKLRDEEADSD